MKNKHRGQLQGSSNNWMSEYLDQNEQDFRSKKFGLVQAELSLIYQVGIHREILNGQLDNFM